MSVEQPAGSRSRVWGIKIVYSSFRHTVCFQMINLECIKLIISMKECQIRQIMSSVVSFSNWGEIRVYNCCNIPLNHWPWPCSWTSSVPTAELKRPTWCQTFEYVTLLWLWLVCADQVPRRVWEEQVSKWRTSSWEQTRSVTYTYSRSTIISWTFSFMKRPVCVLWRRLIEPRDVQPTSRTDAPSCCCSIRWRGKVHQIGLSWIEGDEGSGSVYEDFNSLSWLDCKSSEHVSICGAAVALEKEVEGFISRHSLTVLCGSSQKRYQAVYSYTAAEADEVSLQEGDLISDVEPIDEGWVFGCNQRTGQRGMLPANYVRPVWNKDIRGRATNRNCSPDVKFTICKG